jgi:hypothetical protein
MEPQINADFHRLKYSYKTMLYNRLKITVKKRAEKQEVEGLQRENT